jgi:serine/threonine protein kinase
VVLRTEALLRAASSSSGVTAREVLAEGGQKLVYLADRLGVDVVLKIAKVSGSPDPAALERAHREVQLLEQISHPNIVKALSGAFDLGNPIEAVCWIEELLDGEDLSSAVGAGWAPADVVSMMSDVASGLAELHRRGVVHRDLSAGNVRICSDGYKILDPGFAKHLDKSSLTAFGQPGTPGFLTPEHVGNGTKPTAASDVFCVGILAWLCLVGSLPWSPAESDYTMLLHDRQLPSIATMSTDVSACVADVIDRCLQRQVGRRYFNGQELLDAMKTVS